MTKQLRVITIVVFLMFLALFAASSIIQVLEVGKLNADPRNSRTLLDSYDIQRGSILAGKTTIAESVPSEDQYKYLRKYPHGRMYAAVTGYTTVNMGSSGLENAMNPTLTGKSSSQFFDRVSDILNNRETRGDSIVTTIRPKVQQAAWDALGNHDGAVFAYAPKTGKILAMVSKPSYDPNTLAAHDRKAVLNAYNKLIKADNDPLLNAAIGQRLNHPGSTFKLVMTSAALEAGYKTSYKLPNPSALTLKGTTTQIHNDTDRACAGVGGGMTTIDLALKWSCNIPFAELSLRLGEDTIANQAKQYGFDKSFEIPMKTTASRYPTDMEPSQLQLSAFGQFDVLASPFQMALVAGTIANNGKLMQPNLVNQVRNQSLDIVQRFTPRQVGTPISEDTAKTIQKMMLENVQSGASTNAKIKGVEVGGKTGTAQNAKGGKLTLWFTGVAPVSDPEVAVAVVVENTEGYGNEVAAPIAQKVMKAVLGK